MYQSDCIKPSFFQLVELLIVVLAVITFKTNLIDMSSWKYIFVALFIVQIVLFSQLSVILLRSGSDFLLASGKCKHCCNCRIKLIHNIFQWFSSYLEAAQIRWQQQWFCASCDQWQCNQ